MSLFLELGLKPEIEKAISELGFVTPTPIQQEVIPQLLSTHTDVIALAQTGTGKTAAFGLPVVNAIDTSKRIPTALIICPTRELCMQITDDIQKFSKYLKGLSTVAVYGGANIDGQIRSIKKGVHIIVATPGRMLDIINRRVLDLSEIQTVVLDEADEMLNMGFKEDLDAILSETPSSKRTLLFSATMPPEVSAIARNYMTKPLEVTVGRRNSSADTVKHLYFMVHARDRYLALKRLLDLNPNIYGLVFCRTRLETKEIADQLIQDGYNADALHGDLSQGQRDSVMGRFRSQALQVLVATDVAARGIDVNEITHVINYNLPDDFESYTHRSGRTGRAGHNGICVSIINMREKSMIRRIEKLINKKIEYAKVPSGQDVCQKQLFSLIDRMEKVTVDEKQIGQFMGAVYEKLQYLDKEEIIRRFVSLEFNRFIEYYRNAPDLNAEEHHDGSRRGDRPERGERSDRRDRSDRPERPERRDRMDRPDDRGSRFDKPRGGTPEKGYVRFFINLGAKDRVRPRDLLNLINDTTGDRDINVGSIDIKGTFSFFEVPAGSTTKVMNSFQNIEYNDRDVRIEVAAPPSSDKTEIRGGFERRGR